jgi:competence protein ComEC
MLLGVFIPGTAAAHAIASLAVWTQWLVQRIDELPGTSLRIAPVSALWTIAATVAILWWLARGTRRQGLVIAAIAGAWLAVETWPGLPRGTALRVDTLAVGDGTCHLLRSGREAMLWDCGSLTPGVGRMLVPRAVRALGGGAVPTVIITHPNLDHFNGVLDIVEPLSVRRVLIGRAFIDQATQRPAGPEAYLLEHLRLRGVDVATISAGTTLDLGPSRIEFLSPPADADWPIDNDMSLVATITTATSPARTVLLCGDIQDRAIAFVGGLNLHPDIMEAPHHGSGRGAAVSFVSACSPAVVLQSTGPGRAGDERWDAARRASTWLCTARDGAVSASVMRDGTIRAGPIPR